MPQFGRSQGPDNLPPFAAAARGNISEHPHPLTARIHSSHIVEQDAKMRPIANRWALELRALKADNGNWCPLSSTTPPASLTLTISDVDYLGAPPTPPEFTAYANGTFVLASPIGISGACQWDWRVQLDTYVVHYLVWFGNDQSFPAEWYLYCYLTMTRWGFIGQTSSAFMFQHGPLIPDANGQYDVAGAFPLTLVPQPGFSWPFPEWDYENATLTCEIDTPGDPPVATWEDLPTVVRAWADFRQPIHDPGFLELQSGPLGFGWSIEILLTRVPILPTAGSPGWQWWVLVSKGDVLIGEIRTEQPDSTAAMQYDETLTIPTKSGTYREFDETTIQEGGYFLGVSAAPYPENFEAWNIQERSPSVHDAIQTGLASIVVSLDGFNFSAGLGVLEVFTQAQRLFQSYLNQAHILQPVPHQFGFAANTLAKICRPFHDPDAKVFKEELPGWDNIDGQVYWAAIVATIESGALVVRVHCRTTAMEGDYPWEPIPNPERTIARYLHEQQLGSLHVADGSNGGNWTPLPQPFQSRAISEHPFSADLCTTPYLPGPQHLPLAAGTVKLSSVDSLWIGAEPALQGPLSMPTKSRYEALSRSDGTTPSINTQIDLPLDPPLFQSGDWWNPAKPTKLIVPAGVTRIEGWGNMRTSANANSASIAFFINDAYPTVYGVVNEKGDYAGWTNQLQAYLPPTTVSAGDEVSLRVQKSGANLWADQSRNWLYVRSIDPLVIPVSSIMSGLGDVLPADGTREQFMVIPDSADGFIIEEPRAFYGNAKSVTGPAIVALEVIRASSRQVDELLLSAIQIDTEHWSSDTSTSPPLVNPSFEQLFSGDMLIWRVVSGEIDARGLSLSLQLRDGA